jgi:hypothetical protein
MPGSRTIVCAKGREIRALSHMPRAVEPTIVLFDAETAAKRTHSTRRRVECAIIHGPAARSEETAAKRSHSTRRRVECAIIRGRQE